MSATPRPWTKHHLGHCYQPRCPGHFDIHGADGAEVLPAPLPHDREEDADRIVRAVNAFDALLAVAHAASVPQGEWTPAHAIMLDQMIRKLDAAHPDWRTW